MTEQIVHSSVTSRLDMGNFLLFGLPQDQIERLQHIQNAAARLVTVTRKVLVISHNSCFEGVILVGGWLQNSVQTVAYCF